MSASIELSPPPAASLAASPHTCIRQLVVTESEAEVVIRGRVPTYYLKQMAQEAVRSSLGCRKLTNLVEVSRS